MLMSFAIFHLKLTLSLNKLFCQSYDATYQYIRNANACSSNLKQFFKDNYMIFMHVSAGFNRARH